RLPPPDERRRRSPKSPDNAPSTGEANDRTPPPWPRRSPGTPPPPGHAEPPLPLPPEKTGQNGRGCRSVGWEGPSERSRVSASLFILRIRFTGPSEIGERFVSIHQLFLRLFQYMNYLLIRNSPRLTIHPGINFNLQYGTFLI